MKIEQWARGVVLSVTEIDKHARDDIKALIESCGGIYSPGLSKRCTHLAIPDGNISHLASEKLDAALNNQQRFKDLKVVRLQWLTDSARAQLWLSESKYTVQLVPMSQYPQPVPKADLQPLLPIKVTATGALLPSRGGGSGFLTGSRVDSKSAELVSSRSETPSRSFSGASGATGPAVSSPHLKEMLDQLKALKSGATTVDPEGDAAGQLDINDQQANIASHNASMGSIKVSAEQRKPVLPPQQLPSAYRDISEMLQALKTIRSDSDQTEQGLVPNNDNAYRINTTQSGSANNMGILDSDEGDACTPSQRVLHPVNLKTFGAADSASQDGHEESQPGTASLAIHHELQQPNPSVTFSTYNGSALMRPTPFDADTDRTSSGQALTSIIENPALFESPITQQGMSPTNNESDTKEEIKLFANMAVYIDNDLSEGLAGRVRSALEEGGAYMLDHSTISSGSHARMTTHVVCEPSSVLKWLAMGISTLSPQWVLQSARSRQQQRLLTVTADIARDIAARCLATELGSPNIAAALSGMLSQRQGSLIISKNNSLRLTTTMSYGQGGSSVLDIASFGELLNFDSIDTSTLESRKRLLQDMSHAGKLTVEPEGPSYQGHHNVLNANMGLQLQTSSQVMLTNVVWSVNEAPTSASLHGNPAAEFENLALWEVIPDSEGEEEDEEFCMSATQAIINTTLYELGTHHAQHHDAQVEARETSFADRRAQAMESSSKSSGKPGGSRRKSKSLAAAAPKPYTDLAQNTTSRDEWREEVVFRGRALAILFPRDAKGELGYDCRQYILYTQQATADDLICMIHSHYQEQLTLKEQYELLCSYPGAIVSGDVLRASFEKGKELQRVTLLGHRCSLEGLTKATRDAAGNVYELRVSS